ncbi:MAG: hypothetical protein PHR81_10145 [Bacteroidales bacterium]|jgi:hypothetical protein|nr:hypothetical protein [Bacteroidales bacterium]MDD4215161.1 hypothetical protein [Bacteroidales bacterium]
MEFEESYVKTSSLIKRPETLTRLCLFTFFFSGSMTLFSFGGLFFSGWLANFVSSYVGSVYNIGSSVFAMFFSIMFILFGCSLTGALLMFHMKRSGYWLYLVTNLVILVLSVFIVMNVFNILFIAGTILFIVLYSVQYKHIKNYYERIRGK